MATTPRGKEKKENNSLCPVTLPTLFFFYPTLNPFYPRQERKEGGGGVVEQTTQRATAK